MEITKTLNIKQPIVLLKILENGSLAIIDSNTALRIINMENYNVIGGVKSNIIHERFIGSHIDITRDGKYCLSMIPKSGNAALIDVEKKEITSTIGRHLGEIESVSFDPNGRYCVTCGQDGKVFVWGIKTGRLAFTLPMHTDFVTAVVFSDNAQWIATGSFDRTINLLNFSTMKNPLKLIGHTCVVLKMVFLSEARLLSLDKEGGMIVWDIRTGKVLKRLSNMNDEITALCISDDKQFVFVGTKLGYIGLYDMKTMELMKQRYIKLSECISSLVYISNGFRLGVGTINGNVNFYSLFGENNKYMELVKSHQYKMFYNALEDNPILKYSKPYEFAEKVWTNAFNKAKICLEKGDALKAKAYLDLFVGISSKNSLSVRLLQDYKAYSQFEKLIKEEKYPLAYSISKQYPSFQNSEVYRTMEGRWKKVFAKSQELIMSVDGDEQARTLLAPFRGISEKTALIQALFNERRLYEYFKAVIVKKDFLKFFQLIENHPFLKEFTEYSAVINYADKLYMESQKNYASRNYRDALSACKILTSFPEYSKEAYDMQETIKAEELFRSAIHSNDLLKAFSYLDSYSLLEETLEGYELERQFNNIVDKALVYALQGLACEAMTILEPYRSIRSKFIVIGSVFAQCYNVQLEQKVKSNAHQQEVEEGIRKYIEMFGIDETIVEFFDLFKGQYTTKTDLKMLKQGSLNTWTPAMILSDITVKKS